MDTAIVLITCTYCGAKYYITKMPKLNLIEECDIKFSLPCRCHRQVYVNNNTAIEVDNMTDNEAYVLF